MLCECLHSEEGGCAHECYFHKDGYKVIQQGQTVSLQSASLSASLFMGLPQKGAQSWGAAVSEAFRALEVGQACHLWEEKDWFSPGNPRQ